VGTRLIALDTVAVETFALRAISRISMGRLAEKPFTMNNILPQLFRRFGTNVYARKRLPRLGGPNQQSFGLALQVSAMIQSSEDHRGREVGKRLLEAQHPILLQRWFGLIFVLMRSTRRWRILASRAAFPERRLSFWETT
jgi:hypothetical protein